MSRTITNKNINRYRGTTSYAGTVRLIWDADQLDLSVLSNFPMLNELVYRHKDLSTLEGIEAYPKLVTLDCSFSKLTSLAGLKYFPQLKTLQCSNNQLTSFVGIENCPKLIRLNYSYNRLTSLEGLDKCPQLQDLNCSYNRLSSLAGIENCPGLIVLDCDYNQLSTLKGLAGVPALQNLYCSHNLLTSVSEVSECRGLRNLFCGNNVIVSLEGIESCPDLETIRCYYNQLVSLEQIAYLRRLLYLSFEGNHIRAPSIQVQRCLERLENIRRSNSRSIYANSQNVHDEHVQLTVCNSIKNLLRDPDPKFSIDSVILSGMDERAIRLIVEYCADKAVHSRHLLTYAELLAYVWARIDRSEHKEELIKILAEQVTDAECKCFTGRFNRTLSALVGFYPDIVISISDNSRISAIILAVKARVEPYSPQACYDAARKQLLDAGYTESVIKPWLDAIIDDEDDD